MTKRTRLGLAVLIGIFTAGAAMPASAEFFGCNEPHTKVRNYTSAPRVSVARQSYAKVSHKHAATWSFSASNKRQVWR